MPAKRADVIRAIELISPKREDRDRCEAEVRSAFSEIDATRRNQPFEIRRRSTKGKRAALRLVRTLEDLYERLSDPDLPPGAGLVIRRNPWANPHPTLPHLSYPEVGVWLQEQIDHNWRVGKRKSLGIKPDFEMRRIAAEHAHDLMHNFSQERISAERKSKYCQLAALLYGNKRADLQHACRKVHYENPTPSG